MNSWLKSTGVTLISPGCPLEKPQVAKHLGIVANEIEQMSERPPGIPTQEKENRYGGEGHDL